MGAFHHGGSWARMAAVSSPPKPRTVLDPSSPDWKADLRVISLGAGIQSSTLLYLAIAGELEADAAVFADTQWEPARVYEHLDKLEALAAEAGIPVYRVTQGNLRERVIKQNKAEGAEGSKHFVTIPLHTID